MVTARQIEANRANALRSTGPRSQTGKVASSQNALVHGLTARRVVLDSESAEEFEQFKTAVFQQYKPRTATACIKVEALVEAYWRLRRISVFEAAILEHKKYQFKPIASFDAHENRRRQFEAGLPLLDIRATLIQNVIPKNVLGQLTRYESSLLRKISSLEKQLESMRESVP